MSREKFYHTLGTCQSILVIGHHAVGACPTTLVATVASQQPESSLNFDCDFLKTLSSDPHPGLCLSEKSGAPVNRAWRDLSNGVLGSSIDENLTEWHPEECKPVTNPYTPWRECVGLVQTRPSVTKVTMARHEHSF